MQPIYLDNAASTRVGPDVLALMTEVMRTAWGNPSAAHPQGAAARGYIEQARTRLLAALGDRTGIGDVIWTSGCTEADALAVLGVGRAKAGSIVLSTIEHPAVSAAAMNLMLDGKLVTHVAPDATGVLAPERIAEADTYFASIGANVITGGNRACYIPADDRIHIPHLSQFEQPALYYSTTCHEHVHWTAHSSRLAIGSRGCIG